MPDQVVELDMFQSIVGVGWSAGKFIVIEFRSLNDVTNNKYVSPNLVFLDPYTTSEGDKVGTYNAGAPGTPYIPQWVCVVNEHYITAPFVDWPAVTGTDSNASPAGYAKHAINDPANNANAYFFGQPYYQADRVAWWKNGIQDEHPIYCVGVDFAELYDYSDSPGALRGYYKTYFLINEEELRRQYAHSGDMRIGIGFNRPQGVYWTIAGELRARTWADKSAIARTGPNGYGTYALLEPTTISPVQESLVRTMSFGFTGSSSTPAKRQFQPVFILTVAADGSLTWERNPSVSWDLGTGSFTP